jgi:hypothetical protein
MMTMPNLAISGPALEALKKELEAHMMRTRKQGSSFKVQWVKLPFRWIKLLREAKANGATYDLAHTILVENFRLEQMAAGEIILSEKVTGLPQASRRRATATLVKLNLIKVRRKIGRAPRVVDLY